MAKRFVRTTKDYWNSVSDKSLYNNSIVFIEDSKEIWSNGIYYGGDQLIEISYNDLKILRDNSQLVPGQSYRITDYVTTTIAPQTVAAGHLFDIIVIADSENTLNENARAIEHEGETYFNNSNLKAWELKYQLDASSSWAASAGDLSIIGEIGFLDSGIIISESDSTISEFPYKIQGLSTGFLFYTNQLYGENINMYVLRSPSDTVDDMMYMENITILENLSTGCITYMKDEFNNECEYDFKNIKFIVNKISKCDTYDTSEYGIHELNYFNNLINTNNYIYTIGNTYESDLSYNVYGVDSSEYGELYTFSVFKNGEWYDNTVINSNISSDRVSRNNIITNTYNFDSKLPYICIYGTSCNGNKIYNCTSMIIHSKYSNISNSSSIYGTFTESYIENSFQLYTNNSMSFNQSIRNSHSILLLDVSSQSEINECNSIILNRNNSSLLYRCSNIHLIYPHYSKFYYCTNIPYLKNSRNNSFSHCENLNFIDKYNNENKSQYISDNEFNHCYNINFYLSSDSSSSNMQNGIFNNFSDTSITLPDNVDLSNKIVIRSSNSVGSSFKIYDPYNYVDWEYITE